MALGALIGAYQESDDGVLRALFPLAGRTLVEYQARCAAAAGAAPIVVLVERVPTALNDSFERLRQEGISVIPVSDGAEAATRFEAGELILLLGDGVAPPLELLTNLADEAEPAIVTVPDDEEHERFERIDASSRWAGVALADSQTLRATVAMLGDWDLQSTLLRRVLQAGARHIAVESGPGEPLLAEAPDELGGFERRMIAASRGARRDWASRYILPFFEEFATERLLQRQVRPEWLVQAALLLTSGAAFAFSAGWQWVALAMLVISTPLDLIARRLGVLRLRPLPHRALARRLLWPAAGVALIALGWWDSDGSGWGSVMAALAAAGFAEAGRIERSGAEFPGEVWLFSRRTAILSAIPFAAFGAWTIFLVALAFYAAASFFYVQNGRRAMESSLTKP
jgi:CTP:molybdopterin cytidylyltransferase MocA